MSRRDWPFRVTCSHDGCRESATYRYDTLRDLKASYELKNHGPGTKGWRCVRHTAPNEVLSADNPQTHFEVVSREESYGRYFGSFGFVHGPGFKLFANDFPPGTKLIVTARIELPAPHTKETSP